MALPNPYPSIIQDLMPWDNLQDFLDDFTKGLQEIADALTPDDDNQHRTFVPHTWLTTTANLRWSCFDLTDAFNTWILSYGQQSFLGTCTITVENNEATISNITYIGKAVEGGWYGINSNAAYKELADSLNETFVSDGLGGLRLEHLNPSLTMELRLDYQDAYSQKFVFANTGQAPNVSFEEHYTNFSGNIMVTPVYLWFYPQEFTTDTGEDPVYGDIKMVGRNVTDQHKIGTGVFDCPYASPLIWCTNSDTDAQKYVTVNSADNNYTTTYNTGDGDEFKVYYGDNYIIYVVPDGDKISYDDVYNVTKNVVVPQVDPTIHVKTYRENKYGPEVDYTDDNFGPTTTGFSSNIGGAGNYWLMDLATLGGFISDFKTTAPAGSMISQNILSCYVNALNYEWETGKDNIVIHAAGAQNTPYTSTSQYDYIYQYNPHVIVGQYKVPRVTETFYDFNPYSTYELYIPFCGWIGLPDTVAGRNIRVYMDFDVATMSCKAYVMVEMNDGSGDTICGEITGSFGAPCPVQVIEGGLYKQAMINSGLQIASGVVSGLMGGAFGGPVGASMLAEGGMNAVQGLASAYMAGNTNYGQTIGRAGDTSGLCGGHYCYIKITHPVIDEVVDTETFGHTTGYPCYMESELTDLVGTGFTVCLNPHVHVNCTQSEKEEIKRLLESGVIL